MTVLIESEKVHKHRVDRNSIKRFKDYTQVYIQDQFESATKLKIDLVNDLVQQYGVHEENSILGKIDSCRNILSNKLSALFRFDPKDIVDIWIISRNKKFNWKEIINDAKSKEAGIEPEVIFNIIKSFPIDQLDYIKWIHKPDYTLFKNDLDKIAEDIFWANENSLVRE